VRRASVAALITACWLVTLFGAFALSRWLDRRMPRQLQVYCEDRPAPEAICECFVVDGGSR
jgi:hypothetical protein